MSFQIISSPYGGGVTLGESLELGTPQFRIYECGLSHDVDDWESGEIISPFWCLWHLFQEGSWVECGKEHWDLGPDRVMLAPANVVYSTHNNCPAAQLWLSFAVIPGYAFEIAAPFEIPLDPLLRKQIAALKAAYKGDKRVLYHLAAGLLSTCFARHPLPLRILPEALRAVLQRIENSPGADLSNACLADIAGMSVSGFILWFESYMNQPPAAYVRDVRYQKACRMLMFSELSMEQIAAKLGYPNRHYFSRIFAQRAGCGPAAFRKEHERE
jgi:AraC-like DNA-binding protein